jgi:hypothetical protein
MTRKKVRSIPTDAELVDKFTGQAFKDMIAANWPSTAAPATPETIDLFAAGALSDARIYIRDAGKPAQKTTPERPMSKPIVEAAVDFTMNLQLTYVDVTGEMPSLTAGRHRPGPFAEILRECLVLLKAPSDAVTYINRLQTRSNIITDEKGRTRRKRKPDEI